MNDVLTRLQLAYRRELELYAEVLDLAREGAARARACHPLSVLHEVNERKHALLLEIEAIERTIARDKELWRDQGHAAVGSRDLDTMLEQLKRRIEEILRAERETERWIVAGSGLGPETQPASL